MEYIHVLIGFVLSCCVEVSCWNVAEGKTAIQTRDLTMIYRWDGLYTEQNFTTPNLASNCVDGNTDDNEAAGSCCGVWGEYNGDEEHYWEVDLNGTYSIYNVSVYTSSQERSSTKRLIISLHTEEGYVECRRTDSSNVNAVVREVLCVNTTVASRVRMRNSGNYHIRMCEVEVNALYRVCSSSNEDYFYDRYCSSSCNCKTQCDFTTGVCDGECQSYHEHNKEGVCIHCSDGTFGNECDNKCNCKDQTEVCNKVTGACSECEEEFLDEACKIISPSESDIIIIYESTESNSIRVNVIIIEDYIMYSVIKVRIQVLLNGDTVTSLDVDMRSRTFSSDVVTGLMSETSYVLFGVPFIKSTTNITYEGEPIFLKEVKTNIESDKTGVSIIFIIIALLSGLIVGALVSAIVMYYFMKRRFERDQSVTSECVDTPGTPKNRKEDVRKENQKDTETYSEPEPYSEPYEFLNLSEEKNQNSSPYAN